MSPVTPKSRLSAAERREQLLDATKELVGERGFHDVSIEAIARRAGITRPVIYAHFDDLDALLEAMLEREAMRALGQLGAILPGELPEGGDRSAALLGSLRGYLEAIRSDPVTWRLVLMPPEGAPQVLRDQIERGREAIIAALATTVGPGLSPARPSPDPALTARLLSALSDEAARLLLTDPETYPLERLMAHAEWLLRQLVSD
ncbi:MAG: TetR/AcrR family transcriptional regulator [Thermoleophilaceae bacterium]